MMVAAWNTADIKYDHRALPATPPAIGRLDGMTGTGMQGETGILRRAVE